MSLLISIQHNPVIRQTYQRLVAAGKHNKSRIYGLHAQDDYHSQCHAEKSYIMADRTFLTGNHSRLLGILAFKRNI